MVANCIGLSPLLPNAALGHRFCFEMDLKMNILDFKGKHTMLGFDPAGSMLFIGHCNHENVFLAMAPKQFFRGCFIPSKLGCSSGSSVLSTCHYRQIIIMFAHFLSKIPLCSYLNNQSIYEQDLKCKNPNLGFRVGFRDNT